MKLKFQNSKLAVGVLVAFLVALSEINADDRGGSVPKALQKGARCTRLKMQGPCISLHHRWYYDCDSNTCKPFAWGGCGGNSNRFKNQELCEKVCKKDAPYCKTPQKPKRSMWYLDKSSGKMKRKKPT